MIKNLEEWFSTLRDASLLPNPPVKQRDGKWEIAQRKESWKALGPRIFDEHLDRLRTVSVEVLREKHPQFELSPDERFAASIHGKVLRHSPSLRQGLAETLALLGTMPDALTSCSPGKPEETAVLAVRQTLANADWVLWASVNDHLPTLAEAAPDEFLDAVEHTTGLTPCPFAQVFAQEAGGTMGQNYMTGLLWALETLAWSEEHLQRVTVLLGELAAIDPGGNWANRPSNSLNGIFLPWLPQTCAPIPRRKTAVVALLKEQPAVGWKLLLSLLPSMRSSSSGTRRPAWRSYVPETWSDKVTKAEYREQVEGYAELALGEALDDLPRLAELIGKLPNLPPSARSRIIDHLGSSDVIAKPESSRLPLWEALVGLAAKHRKSPDAQWAMPADAVTQIEAAATKLVPMSPQLRFHRLFSVPDFQLFDEKANFEEQQKNLSLRRQSAVREILDAYHLQGLLDFARQVTNPGAAGLAFGQIDSASADAALLPDFLNKEDKVLRDFVANFVWGRFWTKGWQWVDGAFTDKWTSDQKATFLTFLPFGHDTWRRADAALGDDAAYYWKKVNVQPYGQQPHLLEAVHRFLQHGRPRAALACLDRLVHENADFPPALAVQALTDSLQVSEIPSGFDQHQAAEMIGWLQRNPATNPDDLFRIEWAYLPLLDHEYGGTPATLERRLASDPAFFCEVLTVVFRSEHEKEKRPEPTEAQRAVAENAYRLLHGWQTPPGLQADGAFNGPAFTTWLTEVTRKAKESGRLRIAFDQIGKVLAHAPPDPGGLWIHRSAAEALNDRQAPEMRSGFTCAIFNMRGVHGFTAGKEELQLAERFHKQADALEQQGFHRFATAMREFAKSYEREAARESKRDPFGD
jgi:hypothetical protein